MKSVFNRVALVAVLSLLFVSCSSNENSESQKANTTTQPAATATPTAMTGGGQKSVNENTGASQSNASEITPAVKSEFSAATRALLGVRLRGDSKALAEFLADDYKHTKPDGSIEDKAQYLASLKPFKDFDGFLMDEFKVESLRADDTATVSGLVQAWDKNKKSLYSRFSWTFVKRGATWQLQSSRDTEMKDSY
jgi:hypothetical protein